MAACPSLGEGGALQERNPFTQLSYACQPITTRTLRSGLQFVRMRLLDTAGYAGRRGVCVTGRRAMSCMRQIVVLVSVLAVFASMPAATEELSGYDGEQLFNRFCAACHGKNAEGNGPVAPFFKIAPPDLTRLAKRRGGEFPTEDVRRIIDGRNTKGPHGTRQM